MKDLMEINYVEEQNGIAESLYLLEQRLNEGCADLITILRTLFIYWFMFVEPKYLTNDNSSRDWVQDFLVLYNQTYSQFTATYDYCWVVGYLLTKFPGCESLRQKGLKMLQKAGELTPTDKFVQLAASGGKVSGVELFGDDLKRVEEWGLMGDYFIHVFTK